MAISAQQDAFFQFAFQPSEGKDCATGSLCQLSYGGVIKLRWGDDRRGEPAGDPGGGAYGRICASAHCPRNGRLRLWIQGGGELQ